MTPQAQHLFRQFQELPLEDRNEIAREIIDAAPEDTDPALEAMLNRRLLDTMNKPGIPAATVHAKARAYINDLRR